MSVFKKRNDKTTFFCMLSHTVMIRDVFIMLCCSHLILFGYLCTLQFKNKNYLFPTFDVFGTFDELSVKTFPFALWNQDASYCRAFGQNGRNEQLVAQQKLVGQRGVAWRGH